MSGPRLSVTVLSYNYGRYLAGCLDSILGQTFTDFEVIVIDDRSTDGTSEMLAPYLRDPRVRSVRHEQNLGFVGSLIEGTEKLSHGELVTVISADDLVFDRDAFRQQVRQFDREPGLAFCFSGFTRFSPALREQVTPLAEDCVFSSEEAFSTIVTGRRLHPLHSGTMIRAEAYRRVGGYRRDMAMAIDCALWPLLALEGPVGYVAAPLYGYRQHTGQMSQGIAVGRRCLDEVMRGIDLACTAAAARGLETEQLRRDARDFRIGAATMEDAFAGRRRLALSRWAAAMTYDPALALRSRTLQSALLRALAGERATKRLQRTLGHAA